MFQRGASPLIFVLMEQFVVSARKYRPQQFETVVGQQHITDTLLKAVDNDHLAQALLFCGPRGVGKTTCARILAKVINSDANLTEEELALNVFELDAASNNSVDDIRRLIEQVRFAPQTGKFKVYIIDEVHMLSQQAFNAFLKTLEEPPAHAIFILATTEKHKIIPTILSRCQIFDFKRITVEDIAHHLAFIAEKEGVKAEPEALHLIAEKADGALRDALSLFDRMVSYSPEELKYDQVIQVLDILDYNYFFKTVDLAMQVNYPELMLLYNEVLEKGFNGLAFVGGMAKHFRDLLVAREERTLSLLEVGPAIKERYLAQSKVASTRFLLHGLKVFNEIDGVYKNTSQPRLLVELGLLKLVEFISQEKKKQQQPVSSNQGTDAFLPQSIPSPTTEGQALNGAPEPAPATPSVEKSTESAPAKPAEPAPAEAAPEVKAEEAVAPASTEPLAQQRAPRGRRTGSRKRGMSLTAALDNLATDQNGSNPAEADELAVPEAQSGPQSVFTEHELKTVIEEYAKQRSVGRSIRSVLLRELPAIVDKNTLRIKVENNIQQGLFNEEQPKLVPYLREKLKNFSLRFEVELVEAEQVKKLYLPEEKYTHMAEKNPALHLLREKLNTDLE